MVEFINGRIIEESEDDGERSSGARTPPPVFVAPPPVETTVIFCGDGRFPSTDPQFNCSGYTALPGEFCFNLSSFLIECDPNEGVRTPPPVAPRTPPPVTQTRTIYCCTESQPGSNKCAEGGICQEYTNVSITTTCNDFNPLVDPFSPSGFAFKLIPCDPFQTPPPILITPPPTLVAPPPQAPPPTVSLRTYTVSVETAGGGRVRVDPALVSTDLGAIISQSPQSIVVREGVVAIIEATPSAGFRFVRWNRRINGQTQSFSGNSGASFSVNDDYQLIAIFEQVPTPPPIVPPPTIVPTPPPVVPPPTIVPTPSPIPDPPTPLPTPPPVATPAPVTPPPIAKPTWRSCIDGKLYEGTPPSGYRLATYRGAGGGVCWEPSTEVGFIPSPGQASFVYQRGSSNFPPPFEFEVENPSFGVSYKITFNTNTRYFNVIPREIRLEPQTKKKINIEIKKDTIEEMGDGLTNFNLAIDVEEV